MMEKTQPSPTEWTSKAGWSHKLVDVRGDESWAPVQAVIYVWDSKGELLGTANCESYEAAAGKMEYLASDETSEKGGV